MEPESKNEQNINVLIKDMVEKAFQASGQGVLLSRIGQGLRAQGVDVPALIGKRKLSDYIRSELSEEIALSTSASDPKVVSALPAGKVPAAPTTPTDVKVTQPALPRIATTIWAAFTKPLAADQLRSLEIAPPSFVDLPNSAQFEHPIKALSHTDITLRDAGTSKADYEQKVFEKITGWLVKNGLSVQQVTADAVASRNVNTTKTILEQLCERLSEDQKKRVSLPLDVIERLSEH